EVRMTFYSSVISFFCIISNKKLFDKVVKFHKNSGIQSGSVAKLNFSQHQNDKITILPSKKRQNPIFTKKNIQSLDYLFNLLLFYYRQTLDLLLIFHIPSMFHRLLFRLRAVC